MTKYGNLIFFILALFTVIFCHFAELLPEVGDVTGITSGSHEAGEVTVAHTVGKEVWTESCCAIFSAWGWQG